MKKNIWCTYDVIDKRVLSEDEIPNGFHRGRKKQSVETVKKRKQTLLNKPEEEKIKTRKKLSENSFRNKSKEEKELINEKRSKSLKESWNKKSEEEKKIISEKHKNWISSLSVLEKEEWSIKISESTTGKKIGVKTWNTGLTKETDNRDKNSAEKQSTTNTKHCEKIKQENPEYFTQWRKQVSLSMIKNNSYCKSSTDDKLYEELVQTFGEQDIIRQYSDERYPFDCDFYIKSKDLFIELNAHWTHGGKFFDENDEECICKLNEWKEKAKTSKFYKNAIYVWTDLDVRKKNIANKNNLNYEVIY